MGTWVAHILHDPTYLVFAASSVGTFVALVLAEENLARLRNSVFGTAAGSALGGLIGLYKNQPLLLVVGFVGSAVGGFLGWLVHLALCLLSGIKPLQPLLEYQYGGITSVRQRLMLNEEGLLLAAVREWRASFNRLAQKQRSEVRALSAGVERNSVIRMEISGWLCSFVDVFGLVFDVLASKKEYRSRITVILFGLDQAGDPWGKHWLHYAGPLPSHKTTIGFDKGSIGYQVLSEQLPSPHFSELQKGEKKHEKTGMVREEARYRPFITFRVNGLAVVSLDWPEDLRPEDPYVKLARDIVLNDVVPNIAYLLEVWDGVVQMEVGLNPF